MDDKELFEWVAGLKSEVTIFLDKMKLDNLPGRYRYALEGDIFNEGILGSSIFALKIKYILGCSEDDEIKDICAYINNSKKSDDQYVDKNIYKSAFFKNFLVSIKNHDWSNLKNKNYARAETRQALSALSLYDAVPKNIILNMPKDKDGIETFLNNLDWQKPWHAGSHFSHLMFFLSLTENSNELISYAIDWVNKLQSNKTGCWYKGNCSDQEKVNGAMKVLTGLVAVNKPFNRYACELIDFCLVQVREGHACDNFNIVFNLWQASLAVSDYKQDEIRLFLIDKLRHYYSYYFIEHGGFSFHLGKSNEMYYNAKVSVGKKVPDIHGTVMFMWGISIISEVLGIDADLKIYNT